MTDLFHRRPLTERVVVEPKYLNSRLRESLENLVRNKVEGRCSRHGYIRVDSVVLRGVSGGAVTPESGGSAGFDVMFDADVCNPTAGSVVQCTVLSMTSSTILATNVGPSRVLDIFVATSPETFEHAVDVATIRVSDTITVKILGKRFGLGQTTIACAGQILSSSERPSVSFDDPPSPVMPAYAPSETEVVDTVEEEPGDSAEEPDSDSDSDEDEDEGGSPDADA